MLHWDPRQVGWALAAVGVLSVLVQGGLVRPLVKAIGSRRAMLIGAIAGTLGFAGYGLSATVPMFWIAAMLFGLAGLIAWRTTRHDPE